MKLSSMPTDKATDALVRIMTPFSAIAEDEKTVAALKDIGAMGDGPLIVKISKSAKRILPILLQEHREDLYEILSIMQNKNKKAIREQPFMQTIRDFEEVLKDDDLINFFSSYTEQRKRTERTS